MSKAKKAERGGKPQPRLNFESLPYTIPPDIKQHIIEKADYAEQGKRMSASELTKDLLSYAPQYKARYYGAVLLACIGELFCFVSYFFGAYAGWWVYQTFKGHPLPLSELYPAALIALGAIILYLVFTGISTTLSHRTAFHILAELRKKGFERLQQAPLGYLLEKGDAKLAHTILNRIDGLEDWVAHVVPELPARAIHPIISLIILFYIDWRIGLAALAPFLILMVGVMLMFSNYYTRMFVWMGSESYLAERTTEFVRGIPVIKAFLQDETSYKRLKDATNFYHDSTMNWWRQSWIGNTVMMAGMSSPLLVVLPAASYLYSQGALTTPYYILTLILPLTILPQAFPIMMSFELLQMATDAWVSVKSVIFEAPILDRPKQNDQTDLSFQKKRDHQRGIELKDVHFSYQSGHEVLHGISFTAEKNQVTALVGPSGSGKSTIAKLIVNFWDPSSGEILMEGVNTKNLSTHQLMHEISYVSQDNFLFDTTIRENILLGKPDATEAEMIQASKDAHCHDFIMKLPEGYDTVVGDAGGALSGGERQRITIARTLLKPCSIVVLDEATAYTDPENEALIQKGISKIIDGKSLLVVAHRLHTIQSAHKIIVLDKGSIAGIGSHEELVQSCEVYQKLWLQYSGEEVHHA